MCASPPRNTSTGKIVFATYTDRYSGTGRDEIVFEAKTTLSIAADVVVSLISYIEISMWQEISGTRYLFNYITGPVSVCMAIPYVSLPGFNSSSLPGPARRDEAVWPCAMRNWDLWLGPRNLRRLCWIEIRRSALLKTTQPAKSNVGQQWLWYHFEHCLATNLHKKGSENGVSMFAFFACRDMPAHCLEPCSPETWGVDQSQPARRFPCKVCVTIFCPA